MQIFLTEAQVIFDEAVEETTEEDAVAVSVDANGITEVTPVEGHAVHPNSTTPVGNANGNDGAVAGTSSDTSIAGYLDYISNKEAIWLYAELFSVITITDSHDKIYTTSALFFPIQPKVW